MEKFYNKTLVLYLNIRGYTFLIDYSEIGFELYSSERVLFSVRVRLNKVIVETSKHSVH